MFRVQCKDWTDGQIRNDDSADDVRNVDLSVVHVLSGPFWVNGAVRGNSTSRPHRVRPSAELLAEWNRREAELAASNPTRVPPLAALPDPEGAILGRQPGPVEPRYSEYLVFEGISVDEQGRQHYLDTHVAYRRACLNAIEYLKRFGFTGEQAGV